MIFEVTRRLDGDTLYRGQFVSYTTFAWSFSNEWIEFKRFKYWKKKWLNVTFETIRLHIQIISFNLECHWRVICVIICTSNFLQSYELIRSKYFEFYLVISHKITSFKFILKKYIKILFYIILFNVTIFFIACIHKTYWEGFLWLIPRCSVQFDVILGFVYFVHCQIYLLHSFSN